MNTTNLEWKKVCSAKYSRRSFFPVAEARLPPMLYTFPGSGNTWCRLLIDYGLGIYSGVYFLTFLRAVYQQLTQKDITESHTSSAFSNTSLVHTLHD